MTKGVDTGIEGALEIYLKEPKKPLTNKEVSQISLEFNRKYQEIFQRKIEGEEIGDDFEELLQEYSTIVGEKRALEETIENLLQSKLENEGELRKLKEKLEKINEKIEEREGYFFREKITSLTKRIALILGISSFTGFAGYGIVSAIHTSPEEQQIFDETSAQVRDEVKETLSRLGIFPDMPFKGENFEFMRRSQDVSFSERDFTNKKDFYQLEGEYQGYKLILAIPFSAPENVIIGLGDVKTELTTPMTSDIETFIAEEFQRQEVLRIQKEQEEAMKANEAALKAAEEKRKAEEIALEEARKKAIEAEAERVKNDVLLLPENQAIISEKKSGIQSVIAKLSGNENATLSEPFEMKIPVGDDNSLIFEMIPELGTGNLKTEDFLENGKEFVINSSKLIFDSGENNFGFQINLTINTDYPHNINLILVDSFGDDGPGDLTMKKDFNGQDVSVFLKYLENYFIGK